MATSVSSSSFLFSWLCLLLVLLSSLAVVQAVDGEASKCHFFPYHPSCRGHMSKRGGDEVPTATANPATDAINQQAIQRRSESIPSWKRVAELEKRVYDGLVARKKSIGSRRPLGDSGEFGFFPPSPSSTSGNRMLDYNYDIDDDQEQYDDSLASSTHAIATLLGRMSKMEADLKDVKARRGATPYQPPQARRSSRAPCPDGSMGAVYGNNLVLC